MNAGHATSAAAAPASASAAAAVTASSSHQNGTGGGAAALNTELRAQARRDREATREKGREKLQQQRQEQHALHHHHPHSHSHSHIHVNSSASAPTAAAASLGRERSTSSASAIHVDRKISPKLGTKPASVACTVGGGVSNAAAQRQHTATMHHHGYHQQQQQQHQHPHRSAPLSNRQTSGLDTGATDGGIPSLQGIEGILARIPSPPTLDDEASEQQMAQSTMIVKQYYALLEKCQSWQRYASNMKAKVDRLDIENRYLRETVRKHEGDVRALEEQMRVLKETAMLLEGSGRRNENMFRDGYSIQQQQEQQQAEQGRHMLRRIPLQPNRRPSDAHTFSSGVPSPPSVPLSAPPSAVSRSDGFPTTYLPIADSQQWWPEHGKQFAKDEQAASTYEMHNRYAEYMESHASAHAQQEAMDILGQDAAHRDAAAYHEGRPSTRRLGALGITESHSFPTSDVVPSATLTTQTLAGVASSTTKATTTTMHRLPSSSSAPVLRPHESKMGSATAVPHPQQSSPPLHTLRHEVSEGKISGASSGGKSARSNVNKGKQRAFDLGDSTQLQQQDAYHSSEETRTNGPLDRVPLTARLPAPPARTDGRAPSVMDGRCESVQSDAMTVTEEYMQGIVQQKRQLRKISLSQQQQLHHLQARVQIGHGARSQSSLGHYSAGTTTAVNNENAPLLLAKPFAGAIAGSAGDDLPSRPGSRLSHRGTRGKARSRTGSYSLHDAIPIDKDDVFSTQLSSDAFLSGRITRSGSAMPLGQITLNGGGNKLENGVRSGAVSALELRHYVATSTVAKDGQANDSDDSGEADFVELHRMAAAISRTGSGSISRESSRESLGGGGSNEEDENDLRRPVASSVSSAAVQPSGREAFSSSLADQDDPKGAHRRLYVRLRDELDTPELVRFERYVHKYDALQIEMEGAKGIINRVRRLLLPEALVRDKANQRDRYQFRKELAREFERIVREDAVPSSEGNTQVVSSSQSMDAIVPVREHIQ